MKELKAYMSKVLIQPSASYCATPVLFAKKKDGTIYMCNGLLTLNKIIMKTPYHTSCITSIVRGTSQGIISRDNHLICDKDEGITMPPALLVAWPLLLPTPSHHYNMPSFQPRGPCAYNRTVSMLLAPLPHSLQTKPH